MENMEPSRLSLTEQLKQMRVRNLSTATAESKRISQQIMEELNNFNIANTHLKAGDAAPLFELPDAYGRIVNLADLLKQGPVVVSFFRGAWCSFCTAELRSLQQNLYEIMQLKSSLVAISPQTLDKSLLTVEKNELTYEVLLDLANKTAHQFGIAYKVPELMNNILAGSGVNLEEYNGSEKFELPVPATYVVDTAGIIKYAYVNPDYSQRADPIEIIGALRRLRKN